MDKPHWQLHKGRNRYDRRSVAYQARQEELRRRAMRYEEMKDYKAVNHVQRCPFCAKPHESKDHDIGWYFACCGYARLVWVDVGGRLDLQAVPEDMGDEE